MALADYGSATRTHRAAPAAGTRVDLVMESVRAHIADERLVPGDTIPGESEFALRCGVSRPVAREAFRSLASLAVISTGNGRRPRVAALDPSVLGTSIGHAVATDQMSFQQIFDVRRTIEARIVALAARLASERERTAIVAEARSMERRFAEPDLVREHDIAFHSLLARATRNPLFSLLVDGFAEVTRRTWSVAWQARPDDAARMRSVDTHVAIADAVARGEVARSAELMNEHFDHSLKALGAAGIR